MRESLLESLAEIQTGPFGSQLHKEDYVSKGTPIVTVEHLGNKSFSTQNLPYVSDKDKVRLGKYVLKEGDIVFSRVGSVDRCSYVSSEYDDWMFSGRCLRVRSRNDFIEPEFLYYYFLQESVKQFVRNIAVGATMPSINTSLLGQVPVKYPPLLEQRAISSTLSCLDDKIELNNKINANLEAQAQALFKSWFVDFEPFRDGAFVESELGMIPKGWRVQSIESIAEKVAMGPFGSNIKVNTFVSAGVPIISGNHLRGLYLDEISYNYITLEHANKLKNSLVHAGDIIFTHAGNIGQVAQIPDDCDYPYYIISQRQFYLRCNKNKVVPEYVNYYFHSYEGQGKLLANTTQTGVPSIARPSTHLKSIIIPVPPVELQLKWRSIVKPMLQALVSNRRENKKLSNVRDILLSKLMSGEIEVPNNA